MEKTWDCLEQQNVHFELPTCSHQTVIGRNKAGREDNQEPKQKNAKENKALHPLSTSNWSSQ